MNPVSHFELPYDDKDRMKTFYEKAFGWTFGEWPAGDKEYTFAMTTETDEQQRPKEVGKINGAIVARDLLSQSSLTITAEDAEAVAEKVVEAGGERIGEPVVYETAGKLIYVKDTEGNIIGIWEDEKKSE